MDGQGERDGRWAAFPPPDGASSAFAESGRPSLVLRVSLECVPLPQMWPLLPPSVGLSSVRGNGHCSAPMSSRWVPCHRYLVSEASVLAAWNNDFKSTWSLSFKSETSGPNRVASSFADLRSSNSPTHVFPFHSGLGSRVITIARYLGRVR